MGCLHAAQLSDLPLLLELVGEFHAIERLAFDRQSISRLLTQLLSEPAIGRLWLIVLGEESGNREVIGYLILTFGFSLEYGGRDAFIDELYLRENHRGQGLGALALEEAKKRATELDVHAIHLEVERAKPGVVRLYRENGFEDKARLMMTFKTF